MIPRQRPHLVLPLIVAALLAGSAALALFLGHPRIALTVVILALVITLAILSELISGDR
ncbi:hypothetical protein [Sphingomonas endophytica]|uniref:hypothetical protein n=1 Tax=Sphingomonas endophytica TaxID=869719 RepID=UPI000A9D6881|nr:hypothetical protein [Sphingomonas endophytica]